MSPRLIRVNGGRPQRPLVPTDTIEGYGNRILDLLFTGLYVYTVDGVPVPAMLESLRRHDGRTWTVALRPGWTFSDGSAVTAHDYVRTWNYGADPANRQAQRSVFAPIDGYVPDGDGSCPRLSGLTVLDDLTFTVRLREPDRDFLLSLGFTPFAPLPPVFFESGPEEFGRNPVGNGPYRPAPGSRTDGDRYDLVPREGHQGPRRARNAGLSFVFYEDLERAYEDLLAGRLDILDSIPDSRIADYRTELDRAVDRPVALNKALAVPYSLPRFSGAEGALRRAALSRALDRDRVVQRVFRGTKRAAEDFTAHTLPGFRSGLPGSEALVHDPAAARELWARADAVAPWEGPFRITCNADGGHEDWLREVTEQWRTTLGIDIELITLPTFKDVRDAVSSGTLRTAFRTGWRGDYPSLLSFLQAQFASGSAANETGYRSREFEDALAAARRAADDAEAQGWAARAQAVLFADLPVIPLWDCVNAAGLGAGVDARFSWNGLPDYTDATLARPDPPAAPEPEPAAARLTLREGRP
ncbi:peptide ABC transporter substrate-binding protein [Streptomyces kurssanovii]|uniref:ABC transporter substrate-binding protein n=1 Tax=Streptomyces kurssanovii TaxID=67312 RepID=A0ABV3HU94_9ACTN